MSTSALKTLTIEHLRGSVIPFTLQFEKGKKLTVVYGENGTGKSTICDAFEFLGKGKVGSLENRGLGKTARYWQSLGKNPADVSVTLQTATSSCRASIGKSDVVVTPAEVRPRVEVLRRKQILDLIEAEPGKRYGQVGRFIDVSGVETSEAALRELIADLTKNRDVAAARVQENEDSIRQFWEAAGKPTKEMFAWAEAEAARETTSFDAEIAALGALKAAHTRLTEDPGRLASGAKELSSARDSALAARKLAEQALQSISNDAAEVVQVLEAASTYLKKYPSPSVCPLCESAEKTADLADRIAKRLTTFSAYQKAQLSAQVAERAAQQADQKHKNLLESAREHAIEFEKTRTGHTWPDDVSLPVSPAPEDSSFLPAWLAAAEPLPPEWRKAEAARHDKKQFVSTLRKALKTWRDNTQAEKQIDTLLPRLRRALELVEEERRKFTDSVLAKIAGEVGRLYEAVHPGEGLNKISLELDPSKRASLEIGASFCGQSTRPQAYFSDSHLDTLGLCVFLALSALDEPENTTLVLDDVLASVDEPHVERLIEMLYSEAMKFRHCVITTHYRPWKQKLRWGWLQHGQCQFVELTKWTATNGLALIRSIPPDAERLRKLLSEATPDPQLVCAKAGVILEAVLDFLTQLYESPVPRRANGLYTLGDLLPALDKKLRQSLRVEVLSGRDESGAPKYQTVSLTPILDELTRIAQARNVFGAHFSTLSFEMLESDAIGFGQQVLLLIETLTDPAAGWPKNAKSGSYWATAGETRRLHPLQKPT